MSGNPQFLIAEQNGVEFDYSAEYEPDSTDIYYDPSKVDTVKDRIDLLQLGYNNTFKYVLTQDLTIPSGRSQIISDILEIAGFSLEVQGTGIFEVS